MYHGNFTSSDKIPKKTAGPILIKHNSVFNNLYIDDITVLIVIKNQLLRKNGKFPQSTGENLFTQDSLDYAHQRHVLIIP